MLCPGIRRGHHVWYYAGERAEGLVGGMPQGPLTIGRDMTSNFNQVPREGESMMKRHLRACERQKSIDEMAPKVVMNCNDFRRVGEGWELHLRAYEVRLRIDSRVEGNKTNLSAV